MPDYGLCQDDGVRPRRPTKSDYVSARQFGGGELSIACRLWLNGHRRIVPHAEARRLAA